MSYTPEQLREWADNKAEVRWLSDQLRAHAAALEELAALRAQLAERDTQVLKIYAAYTASVQRESDLLDELAALKGHGNG